MKLILPGIPSRRPQTNQKGGRLARWLTAIAFSMLAVASYAADPITIRSDWSKHFREFKATGAIIVRDERANAKHTSVYDLDRVNRRYSPASSFKIPHALFALEAGLVKDEFQVFRWDGTKRNIDAWNADQDLRSSMRGSVVWVYQGFARGIGEGKAKAYLENIGYGNADPSGGKDGYWIDGNLRVSALEQVNFLQRLYRNDLPFQVEHQRLVKDIMIVEAGDGWILRAKTGWEGRMGWWVGWVEWREGPVFFALNIDTPNRMDDLYKRRAIAESVLRSIGALPQK